MQELTGRYFSICMSSVCLPLWMAVQLLTIAFSTTVKSYAGLSSLVVIPIVFGAFNTTAGALITGLITSILRHHRVHAQQRHIDPLSPVQNKVYAHYAVSCTIVLVANELILLGS
jgi:hypothetical protein